MTKSYTEQGLILPTTEDLSRETRAYISNTTERQFSERVKALYGNQCLITGFNKDIYVDLKLECHHLLKDDRFEARTNFFNVVVLCKELHTLYHKMYGFKGDLINFQSFREFLKYLGQSSGFEAFHSRISHAILWIQILENNYTAYELMDKTSTTYEVAPYD